MSETEILQGLDYMLAFFTLLTLAFVVMLLYAILNKIMEVLGERLKHRWFWCRRLSQRKL